MYFCVIIYRKDTIKACIYVKELVRFIWWRATSLITDDRIMINDYTADISAERSWLDVDISSSGRLRRHLKIGLTIMEENI